MRSRCSTFVLLGTLFIIGCSDVVIGTLSSIDRKPVEIQQADGSTIMLPEGLMKIYFEPEGWLSKERVTISPMYGESIAVQLPRYSLLNNKDFTLSAAASGINYDLEGRVHRRLIEEKDVEQIEACPVGHRKVIRRFETFSEYYILSFLQNDEEQARFSTEQRVYRKDDIKKVIEACPTDISN